MDRLKQEFEKALELLKSKNEADKDAACEKLLSIAEADDTLGEIYSKSYYHIGRRFERQKDYKTATKYYTKAYKCPEPFSKVYTELGRMYYFNYIGEPNYLKAYSLFCEGEEAGEKSSWYFIGLCHFGDRIEGADYKKAFKYFMLDYNDSKSRYSAERLIRCYTEGIGTAVDLNAALAIADMFSDNAEILALAGDVLIKLNRMNEAKKRFEKILSLNDEKASKKAKSKIDEIYNILEPNAVLNKAQSCPDSFEEIEIIIKAHPKLNAEAIYDLAVKAENEGDRPLSVKLYVISAAAGCKKAGYTLSNMAAENTKYFTNIIECGEN